MLVVHLLQYWNSSIAVRETRSLSCTIHAACASLATDKTRRDPVGLAGVLGVVVFRALGAEFNAHVVGCLTAAGCA